jgi:hypothetical protein
MPINVPDYVLTATTRILDAFLPLLRRAPGPISDAALYASYRKTLDTLLNDTRAAARSTSLGVDIATVINGFRAASANPAAVIDTLDRVINAARAWVPVDARNDTLGLQRFSELSLCGLFEALAISAQCVAISTLTLTSYNQALAYRNRMRLTTDTAIDRASDAGQIAVVRALRDLQAKVTRDLINRGNALARIVTYSTGVPLPSVVLSYLLYQDGNRADELLAENPIDHPSFMPMTGQALSK